MNYYIPISRSLFEHPLWCEERVYSKFEAWIDLLQSSRFEDTKQIIGNRMLNVKRGQILISLRFLASRWKWSPKKVNSFLECLITEGMIIKETPKETGQTVLTVCNYDKYNPLAENRKQAKKQKENSKETAWQRDGNSKGTVREQLGNKINKLNKENKENNNNLSISLFESNLSFVSDEYQKTFALWLEYKKDRRENYKSEKSLKACYNKLVKLSKGDPMIASQIIDEAIANNWAGFFELKNNRNEHETNEGKNDTKSIDAPIIRTLSF